MKKLNYFSFLLFLSLFISCSDEKKDAKEIILITEKQLNSFVGNIIELEGTNNQKYIVMSTTAHNALTPTQIGQLSKHGQLLSSDLEVIETCGGGSARCMIAEIFVSKV